jgi:hypothetical protein
MSNDSSTHVLNKYSVLLLLFYCSCCKARRSALLLTKNDTSISIMQSITVLRTTTSSAQCSLYLADTIIAVFLLLLGLVPPCSCPLSPLLFALSACCMLFVAVVVFVLDLVPSCCTLIIQFFTTFKEHAITTNYYLPLVLPAPHYNTSLLSGTYHSYH